MAKTLININLTAPPDLKDGAIDILKITRKMSHILKFNLFFLVLQLFLWNAIGDGK